MTQPLHLKKYCSIKAIIFCKSGVNIGGTESGIAKGVTDSPVIKNLKGEPYFPGSSLKGKLRSILEYHYNRGGPDGKPNGEPCGCGQKLDICQVCTIFGPHRRMNHELGPTRIIVRDAFLSEKSLKDLRKSEKEGKPFTEIKTETQIDRRTGVAANQTLRTKERIEPGTEFELNISLRIFDDDDENKIIELIKEALTLLSKDTLGGSGSRGYGWVEIKNIEVNCS